MLALLQNLISISSISKTSFHLQEGIHLYSKHRQLLGDFFCTSHNFGNHRHSQEQTFNALIAKMCSLSLKCPLFSSCPVPLSPFSALRATLLLNPTALCTTGHPSCTDLQLFPSASLRQEQWAHCSWPNRQRVELSSQSTLQQKPPCSVHTTSCCTKLAAIT